MDLALDIARRRIFAEKMVFSALPTSASAL